MPSAVSLTTSFFSVRATKSTADSFSLGTTALQCPVEPLKKEVLSETVEQQQQRKTERQKNNHASRQAGRQAETRNEGQEQRVLQNAV